MMFQKSLHGATPSQIYAFQRDKIAAVRAAIEVAKKRHSNCAESLALDGLVGDLLKATGSIPLKR